MTTERCGESGEVGGVEVDCHLPDGHDGKHYDGLLAAWEN